jgi:KDO2-lipid IV(A) lauroyltransferase
MANVMDDELPRERGPLALAGCYLSYLAVRAALCLAQALPLSACQRAADALCWLFADVLRLRLRVVQENLAHALPELSAAERTLLTRRMWRHLFLLAVETAHAPRKIHPTNWREYFDVDMRDGKNSLTSVLLRGRPFLLVTGHFGNFEMAGYLLGLLGYRTTAVARPLDNPYLDRFIYRSRSRDGQRILSKQTDYPKILDTLAAGEGVSFLADQYAGSRGCWVDFFGRPASTHKAIALFALQHDAPIWVGACTRGDRPLRFVFLHGGCADPRDLAPQERDVRRLTQWHAAALEGLIRTAPDQYWWLHRRWKDHRAADRRARQAA